MIHSSNLAIASFSICVAIVRNMFFSKAYYILFALTKLFVVLLSSHVFARELADTTQPHNSPVLFSQIHTNLQTKLDGTPEMGQNSFTYTLTSKFKGQCVPQTSKFGGQSNPHCLTVEDTYGTSKFGDQSGIQASKFRGPLGHGTLALWLLILIFLFNLVS